MAASKQKSFIGGVPTDKILDVLDEDEEEIEKKLKEITDGDEAAESQEEEVADEDLFEEEPDSDDGMDNGIPTDPQVLKLQDRIKFFRYRCVASLGNNLYERAYDFLKQSNSEGATAEEKREGLISILGEDCIGFWAILDQILFYEGMVDELNTLNDFSEEATEFSDDEIQKRRGVDEALGMRAALNEDSDLEENDGEMVGGSGSEKGAA